MNFPSEYEKAYKKGVKKLEDLLEEYESYYAAAEAIGVHRSDIWQVLNEGRKPRSGKIAEFMELPEVETIIVITCTECGQPVIGRHKCPVKVPELGLNDDRPSRIRIDLDPDMSLEDAEKVRNLPREVRTRILVMTAKRIEQWSGENSG